MSIIDFKRNKNCLYEPIYTTQLERYPNEETQPFPYMPCAEGPNQELWQVFHRCWGQAQDSGTYDKAEWPKLEKLIQYKRLNELPTLGSPPTLTDDDITKMKEVMASKAFRPFRLSEPIYTTHPERYPDEETQPFPYLPCAAFDGDDNEIDKPCLMIDPNNGVCEALVRLPDGGYATSEDGSEMLIEIFMAKLPVTFKPNSKTVAVEITEEDGKVKVEESWEVPPVIYEEQKRCKKLILDGRRCEKEENHGGFHFYKGVRHAAGTDLDADVEKPETWRDRPPLI